MKILVGNTGFVGSNICRNESFDGLFHSSNVEQAFETKPDLLIYAGLRAEKFLANHDPQRDLATIHQAFDNIRKIAPKRTVLISTVDVFKRPLDVFEDTKIDTEGLGAYGFNRYQLEERVREAFEDALIVRLPGLYGTGIKKNFLFDIIHRTPVMLDKYKYENLSQKSALVADAYHQENNGYYKLRELTHKDKTQLRKFFIDCSFNALSFTDSRSVFQFYPLRFLWQHIQTALNHNLRYLNVAVEPIEARDIYEVIAGEVFRNELPGVPANYRMKTRFDTIFNGSNGFILDRTFLLQDIISFAKAEIAQLTKGDEQQ